MSSMEDDLALSENESPFYQTSIVLKAALLPSQSSFPMEAVKNQIHTLLFSYHEELEGIPLSYSDIKLVKGKEYCRILGEQPWLHVDLTLKLLVFKPRTGIKLLGRVTMVSDNHISLLVFDMFNASITGENLRKNFVYNDKLKHWETSTNVIREGEQIEFELPSFNILMVLLTLMDNPYSPYSPYRPTSIPFH